MERLRQLTKRFFLKDSNAGINYSDFEDTEKSAPPRVEAKFVIDDDPSNDSRFLFAESRIEALVREGRTPLRIGTITAVGGEPEAFYQTPPRDFKPEEIDHVYMCAAGAYAFVKKDGSQKVGPTYALNQEQARLLEERIAAEQIRMRAEKDTLQDIPLLDSEDPNDALPEVRYEL